MTDAEELLLALHCERAGASNKRPSVHQAQLSQLPDWSPDRLFSALERLIEDQLVMNPTAGMVNVDITSTGNRRIAELTAPPVPQSIHIGSAINSPVQQVGGHGTGTQTTTYTLDRQGLESFISHYREHVFGSLYPRIPAACGDLGGIFGHVGANEFEVPSYCVRRAYCS